MDTCKLVAIACAVYSNGLNDSLLENSTGDEMISRATKDLMEPPTYIESVLDVEAYILRYSDSVVIAFRGTDSLRDVCEDAMFALCNWDSNCNAKVHEGIFRQYKSVEKELVETINDAKAKGFMVICTGHSSGAALACFLATATNTNYVGFGAPKVGNDAFRTLHADKCKGNISYTYVNGSDPIPKLPLGPLYVQPAAIIKVGPRDRLPFLPTLSGLYYHSNASYYKAVVDKVEAKSTGLLDFLCGLFHSIQSCFESCMGK
jgi:Lipase (class 3)